MLLWWLPLEAAVRLSCCARLWAVLSASCPVQPWIAAVERWVQVLLMATMTAARLRLTWALLCLCPWLQWLRAHFRLQPWRLAVMVKLQAVCARGRWSAGPSAAVGWLLGLLAAAEAALVLAVQRLWVQQQAVARALPSLLLLLFSCRSTWLERQRVMVSWARAERAQLEQGREQQLRVW